MLCITHSVTNSCFYASKENHISQQESNAEIQVNKVIDTCKEFFAVYVYTYKDNNVSFA